MKRLPWFALMVAVLVFVGAVVAWVLSRPTHEPRPDVTITVPLRRTPPKQVPRHRAKRSTARRSQPRRSRTASPQSAGTRGNSGQSAPTSRAKSPTRRSPKTAPDRRRPNTGQGQGQGGSSSESPPPASPSPSPPVVLTVPAPVGVCTPLARVNTCD